MLEEQKDNLQDADGAKSNSESDVIIESNDTALSTIENSNAEDGEDETSHERHDIAMLDYDTLSMEELTAELENLVGKHKVNAIKDHVEEIKKAFHNLYTDFIEEKKEAFDAENTDENASFEYNFPLKTKFDSIFDTYKTERNKQYKSLQNNLKSNLEIRNQLNDELKELVDGTDENLSIGDMFKKLNDIRERWKNAGSIPRDKYNIVWNNFHFHLERFYDLMHLDKEARDQDFKNNLEQKLVIIEKAKTLLDETDVMRAFRELQLLHKVWKEEIGPVDGEHREKIWNEFSDITKQLHDKREGYFGQAKEREAKNLLVKNAIIDEIQKISATNVKSHNAWQDQIKKVEAYRELFFKSGKVPAEEVQNSWTNFKKAVREFNVTKNTFYKEIKGDQQENLNKKMALVAKAKSLQESEDFNAATPKMKQIQEDWKKIGHVPRKFSDKIWKEFRTACNQYFDRLHKLKDEENKEANEIFDKKQTYLDSLKEVTLSGNHKENLATIKTHINTWKEFGKVPFNKRHIEGKFNKVLDGFFEQLSLSKKETDSMKFDNKIDQWLENDDKQALEKEQFFLRKKIEEVQNEILQLENNIQFITTTKKDNPFLNEVHKNIEKHKDDLLTWKEKLAKVKAL